MAYGKTPQIERGRSNNMRSSNDKMSRYLKRMKHRVERRRAKLHPECPPEYRKYQGYEF